jgi:hypothetical protein
MSGVRVARSLRSQRRTDNAMAKRKRIKGQITIYKTLHRKLKIEKHESNSCNVYRYNKTAIFFESFKVVTMIWLRKYLCHKWPNNHGFVPFFTCCKNFPILSSIMTYHRVCNYWNKTGATSRTRTAYNCGTI